MWTSKETHTDSPILLSVGYKSFSSPKHVGKDFLNTPRTNIDKIFGSFLHCSFICGLKQKLSHVQIHIEQVLRAYVLLWAAIKVVKTLSLETHCDVLQSVHMLRGQHVNFDFSSVGLCPKLSVSVEILCTAMNILCMTK